MQLDHRPLYLALGRHSCCPESSESGTVYLVPTLRYHSASRVSGAEGRGDEGAACLHDMLQRSLSGGLVRDRSASLVARRFFGKMGK